MNRRELGRTGRLVNEIGYGSMSLGTEPGNRPTERESIMLIERAVDELGVELIDTADVYCSDDSEIGYTERIIARALSGERRHRVVIATKGGFTRPGGAWRPDGRPQHLRAACERSLQALETDVIDLYQLHLVDRTVPFEESLGAIIDLQREGKVRHIGLSNVTVDQLEHACSHAAITSLQNALSPMTRTDERDSPARFCETHGITWIAYAPLGGHRNGDRIVELEGWMRSALPDRQESPRSLLLAWLLHFSPSTIPIPATRRFEHLAENMGAAEIRLTEEEVAILGRPRTWVDLHDELVETGDYAGAIEQLMIGLSFYPNDAGIWYNLACACARDDRPAQALDALRRSIACGFDDPDHARADEDLASLRGLPEFEEALSGVGTA